MAHIEKQRGKYRARFADPLGKIQSRTFTRKADAERFLREVDADSVRGRWVDPRNAETPLAEWADEFLLLCRRLSPPTQETYRRDLDRYVLSRFVSYRLGQLPADEIENWLNDERLGHRAIVSASALSNAAANARGRGPEAEDPRKPVRTR